MQTSHKSTIYAAIGSTFVVGSLVFGLVWLVKNQNISLTKDNASTVGTPTAVASPVHTTSPLVKSSNTATELTTEGVFKYTNIQRATYSQQALTYNTTLAKAASNKVADMIKNNYFEHVSPQGKGPSDFVTGVGYAYITVGENLAMGYFGNDEKLVQAWMDSPGHRENILRPTFTEIGIGVGMGVVDGQMTWLAVQEFGKPLSDCSKPSATLNSTIDSQRATYEQMISQSDTLKAQIESTVDPVEKNQLVDQYNALVAEINTLKATIDTNINTYNLQVSTYNACVDVS